jgi:hypothetical protein
MEDPRVQNLKTLDKNPLTEEEEEWVKRIPPLPIKKLFREFPYQGGSPRHPLNRNLPEEMLKEIAEQRVIIQEERKVQDKEQPFKKIKK